MTKYLRGLAMAIAVAVVSVSPLLAGHAMASNANCNIKGNINPRTGERIYHVPGQRYYNETQISPQHGERWFCSEAEARAAGWRRARV